VREVGGVANWYFSGHANKATLDLHRVTIRDESGASGRWRVRGQWDVSF